MEHVYLFSAHDVPVLNIQMFFIIFSSRNQLCLSEFIEKIHCDLDFCYTTPFYAKYSERNLNVQNIGTLYEILSILFRILKII